MFNDIVRREQDLGALNLYPLATFNASPVLLLMEFDELLHDNLLSKVIVMELTELSLASSADKNCNFCSSSDHHHHQVDGFDFPSKKRKMFTEEFFDVGSGFQTSVDLQVKDPLPLDWEQCLDLESGRMYYMNRKTLKKIWNWPKDQNLNLELNISNGSEYLNGDSISIEDSNNKQRRQQQQQQKHSSSTTNMVALACLNCHLLVILSESSPSCPNCKYVHSLPTLRPTKSLNTLSLLN